MTDSDPNLSEAEVVLIKDFIEDRLREATISVKLYSDLFSPWMFDEQMSVVMRPPPELEREESVRMRNQSDSRASVAVQADAHCIKIEFSIPVSGKIGLFQRDVTKYVHAEIWLTPVSEDRSYNDDEETDDDERERGV